MHRTRYNPPAAWKPKIAATEDARLPWSGLNRGLVWGEVHDENAYSLGGVAGHAGVFSCAWDLAILGRTLLNGGAYGSARILEPETVDLMFTDFNTAFPGDEHGLGFELYQHWYMGAMATPRTAGHTGFTGTSLVLDPTTDSFLIVLGNSVHPARSWRSGSAPRVAAANNLARAVPVRPARGRTSWFSGMTNTTTATLTLPALDTATATATGPVRLRCALWWDTEPQADRLSSRRRPTAARPGSRFPSRRPRTARNRRSTPPARSPAGPDGSGTGSPRTCPRRGSSPRAGGTRPTSCTSAVAPTSTHSGSAPATRSSSTRHVRRTPRALLRWAGWRPGTEGSKVRCVRHGPQIHP